jgi:dipeptidyl aminopeptidase/acylaminoacyl peptidase
MFCMSQNPSPPAAILDARRLLDFKRVGALALAPDGAKVVCTVTAIDVDANTSRTSLWLCSTNGDLERRLTFAGKSDTEPSWAPNGKRLAFLSRREQEGQSDTTAQIYVIDPHGGEATRLTDFAPGVESFKWCPDNRHIVFSSWIWPQTPLAKQAEAVKADKATLSTGIATDAALYRYWDHFLPNQRRLHLLRLDTQTGKLIDLFAGSPYQLPRDEHDSNSYNIHPDGQSIAFLHDFDLEQPRLGNPMQVSSLAIKTRMVATLGVHGFDHRSPSFSPDGSQLAYLRAPIQRDHTAMARVCIHDCKTGRIHEMAPTWDREPFGSIRWSALCDAVWFRAEDRGRCSLWQLPLDAAQPNCAVRGGWVQGFALAANHLVYAADSARHPVRVYAVPLMSPSVNPIADALRIESFNNTLMEHLVLGTNEERWISGANKAKIQVWLTYPPNFDPERKYPVTHVIHGGPYTAAGDTWGYRWNPHVIAAAQQVVMQVNFHGSSGFGQAFKSSLIGTMGAQELIDIDAATTWVRKQPWCDTERVHATGGSYGGFLVAWMNGHCRPGRYRKMICHAGVFDRVATASADSYLERPKDLGAFYWDDMAKVLSQSPHAFVNRMQTPTLVIHGALDYRVPDTNGLAYYNALKARGVAARLLWFPDEGHWILKPQNALQWYREFLAWLAD